MHGFGPVCSYSGKKEVWAPHSPFSPGCCTATKAVRSSSRMTGPQVSASRGTERNCSTRPRASPSRVTRKRPSFLPIPPGWPSVEIHRLPTESKARLSGQEIGETCSGGKPEK